MWLSKTVEWMGLDKHILRMMVSQPVPPNDADQEGWATESQELFCCSMSPSPLAPTSGVPTSYTIYFLCHTWALSTCDRVFPTYFRTWEWKEGRSSTEGVPGPLFLPPEDFLPSISLPNSVHCLLIAGREQSKGVHTPQVESSHVIGRGRRISDNVSSP